MELSVIRQAAEAAVDGAARVGAESICDKPLISSQSLQSYAEYDESQVRVWCKRRRNLKLAYTKSQFVIQLPTPLLYDGQSLSTTNFCPKILLPKEFANQDMTSTEAALLAFSDARFEVQNDSMLQEWKSTKHCFYAERRYCTVNQANHDNLCLVSNFDLCGCRLQFVNLYHLLKTTGFYLLTYKLKGHSAEHTIFVNCYQRYIFSIVFGYMSFAGSCRVESDKTHKDLLFYIRYQHTLRIFLIGALV